eukprot:5689504-Alexandrium_andersonii.AAC.1
MHSCACVVTGTWCWRVPGRTWGLRHQLLVEAAHAVEKRACVSMRRAKWSTRALLRPPGAAGWS